MKIRQAELSHEDGMRFSVVTGSGRRLVLGTNAEANEHSPVELVVAALAGCAAMDVASILAKKRQVVDSYTVTIVAIQREEHPQVLLTVELLHDVAGPVLAAEAVRRSIELSATTYCPVNAMLSAGSVRIRHGYRARRTGPDGFDVEGIAAETGPAPAGTSGPGAVDPAALEPADGARGGRQT
jgi:putative redox protein